MSYLMNVNSNVLEEQQLAVFPEYNLSFQKKISAVKILPNESQIKEFENVGKYCKQKRCKNQIN